MADKELRAHLRVTGENAAKVGLKGFGDEAAKAGDKVHDLGDETGFLGKQVEATEVKVKELIKTLNETGDVTLLKEIRKGKRELKLFDNLKKELEAEVQQAAVEVAVPAASNSGGIIGEGLAKGIGAAVAAGGPALMAGLGVAIAMATPFIGGAVATAVVGSAGLGGIAGGIAMAAQDSRVKGAAEQLGHTALAAFESAGQAFVEPVIDSLGTLERASQDIASKMGQGFATLAPTLAPLTDGVVGFVSELVDDLVAAMEQAKPVIRAIANELPEIGDALGDFFGIIAEDPDGAIMAMKNLSMIIQGTLRAAGHTIAVLSDIYVWSVRAAGATAHFMEDTFGWIPIIGDWFGATANRADNLLAGLDAAKDASHDFAGGLHHVATEADRSAEELGNMKDAINDLFDKTMNLDEATLRYRQGVVDLREELLEGKRTLDLNTQAGRDNMETAQQWINLIEGMRDAEAESTLGIEEANKRYAERLEALKKEMLQMGYNKKAVEELITKYLAVPHAVEINVIAKFAGDAQAWAALRNVERKTVPITSNGPGGFVSSFDTRAGGGPTRRGRTYLVGENGPELWSENSNGYITNASQTAAMMSGASGGASGGGMTLSVAPSTGGDLERVLWEFFAKRLQVDGGAIGQFRVPRIT